MTLFQIVGLYSALYILLFIYLTIRVIQLRLKGSVSIGDQGDEVLARRVRAHGNFAECTPFMMFGLFAIAMLGGAPIVLHMLGGSFLVGRLLHARGMVASPVNKPRQVGMLLSLISLLFVALYLIYLMVMHSPV